MYCANCGTKLDKGSYCPRCGAPVREQPTALPPGITRDENGALRWAWKDRDYTHYYCIDGSRVVMQSIPNEKEDTVGSAFREMMKSGLALVASGVVRSSDAYNGQDLPWDSTGDGVGGNALLLADIKKIKPNPKKNEIVLREILSTLTLHMTAAQYACILDCVIRSAPNARVKP